MFDKCILSYKDIVVIIFVLIFLSIGQYSAIGLVLTAKSIARFDRISKEDFAEYYLPGTLISTVIVIISSFII